MFSSWTHFAKILIGYRTYNPGNRVWSCNFCFSSSAGLLRDWLEIIPVSEIKMTSFLVLFIVLNKVLRFTLPTFLAFNHEFHVGRLLFWIMYSDNVHVHLLYVKHHVQIFTPSGCNSVVLITGSNGGEVHNSIGSAGCTS
jgi:hypothetical protein